MTGLESFCIASTECSTSMNNEQFQSENVNGNTVSHSACENNLKPDFTLQKAEKLQDTSEKREEGYVIKDSAASQPGELGESQSSFTSHKLNTAYLDRFITSAVVSSELIRMRM